MPKRCFLLVMRFRVRLCCKHRRAGGSCLNFMQIGRELLENWALSRWRSRKRIQPVRTCMIAEPAAASATVSRSSSSRMRLGGDVTGPETLSFLQIRGESVDRRRAMRPSRLMEERIVAMLKEQEAVAKTADVRRNHGSGKAGRLRPQTKTRTLSQTAGGPGPRSVERRRKPVGNGRFPCFRERPGALAKACRGGHGSDIRRDGRVV